jgi:hypothetical protein
MMTETEDASLDIDLEAILGADGEVNVQPPLPQTILITLDDVSTLASDMPTKTLNRYLQRSKKKLLAKETPKTGG